LSFISPAKVVKLNRLFKEREKGRWGEGERGRWGERGSPYLLFSSSPFHLL